MASSFSEIPAMAISSATTSEIASLVTQARISSRGGDGNDILMRRIGDNVTMGRRGVDHFVYLDHAGHDAIQECSRQTM